MRSAARLARPARYPAAANKAQARRRRPDERTAVTAQLVAVTKAEAGSTIAENWARTPTGRSRTRAGEATTSQAEVSNGRERNRPCRRGPAPGVMIGLWRAQPSCGPVRRAVASGQAAERARA